MQSLKDNFETLRQRLGHGREIDSTGTEPIYYLVFPVAEILEVKRQTKTWIARLANDGWNVVPLSLADTIAGIFQNHKLRKLWLASEQQLLAQSEKARRPLDPSEINKTLAKALSDNSQLAPELRVRLDAAVASASAQPNGLLLLTDLEALHPYLRINTIEDYLRGRIRHPVIVLYPGQREGKTSLRFLEFYPPDPNYRSDHIG
ncbi:MAG: DUF1788 domain-containing protein [Verrucomicrobiales bacterium]|nr:DUF1788 domain-containing protein [Verrucomicrobiales bacterium]